MSFSERAASFPKAMESPGFFQGVAAVPRRQGVENLKQHSLRHVIVGVERMNAPCGAITRQNLRGEAVDYVIDLVLLRPLERQDWAGGGERPSFVVVDQGDPAIGERVTLRRVGLKHDGPEGPRPLVPPPRQGVRDACND